MTLFFLVAETLLMKNAIDQVPDIAQASHNFMVVGR